MAASILREITGSVLKYDPRNINLSGIIDPEKTWHQDGGHSWWSSASEDYYNIYGFNPEAGLKQLDIKMSYAYSQNGEKQPEGESESLAEYCRRTKQSGFIFFVVDHSGKEYGESGEEFRTVTVYKSPDFSQYWQKVTAEDVERWEKWLNV